MWGRLPVEPDAAEFSDLSLNFLFFYYECFFISKNVNPVEKRVRTNLNNSYLTRNPADPVNKSVHSPRKCAFKSIVSRDFNNGATQRTSRKTIVDFKMVGLSSNPTPLYSSQFDFIRFTIICEWGAQFIR